MMLAALHLHHKKSRSEFILLIKLFGLKSICFVQGSPMYNTLTPNARGSPMASDSLELLDSSYVDPKILTTSARPSQLARANLFRPKNLLDKAKHNIG